MIDDAKAAERRRRRMEQVDSMPQPLRALVHEYGLTIVKAFIECGVTKPRRIKHLIDTVRNGSEEIGRHEAQSPIPNGWNRAGLQ